MNQSETDIELVEKYFDAALDERERQDFSRRLKADESFRQLVEREQALVAAVRYEGLAKDLQYLKQVEKTLSKGSSISVSRKWVYYAAAAAVVAILAAVIFIAPTFRPSPDQLFQAYFVPYPNILEPALRSNESSHDTRAEALAAYDQKDYQRAADLFTSLLAEKEESGVLLLLGNANLILGNTDKAIENFSNLSKDFDDLDMQAKWYLSLCYLKRGDVTEAKRILEELGETEISYAEKAKELLKKVK